MRYKYEIILGVEYDTNKELVKEHDLTFTLTEVARIFGGYSIIKMIGGYIMNLDGALVQESSLNITILSDEIRDLEIKGLAHEFKTQLNQESVLIVKTDIKASFI